MRFSHVSRFILGLVVAVAMSNQSFGQEPSDKTVILWNNAAIRAAQDSNSGGLVMVRAIAMMHTAMFNAWSQYDKNALPTLGYPFRSAEAERTIQNKREAISFAAYGVLADLFPSKTADFDRLMVSLGYDPQNQQPDRVTAAGVGHLAAYWVLEYRHNDGANQLGDLHPGAYSDYTGYATANAPDSIRDPDRWQPLNQDRNGQTTSQIFYMPQWGRVQPFSYDSVLDVRPHTNPKSLSSDPAGYIRQAKDIVELTSRLSEREKVIAEYWEASQGNGTNFVLWNQFAQFVSQRDHYQLDDQVKLFFAINNAMFDTSIAAWDAKRYWDSERPQTAIVALAKISRGYLFREDWQPYLPTPPFPDFVSSHSAVSASAAEILKRFTGSDMFGGSYRRAAKVSGMEGKPGPSSDVVLSWATFTDAADESGMSRRYGGLHFEDADVEGRLLGRRVGSLVWNEADAYMSGTKRSVASFSEERK